MQAASGETIPLADIMKQHEISESPVFVRTIAELLTGGIAMEHAKTKKSMLLGWGVGDLGFQLMIMVSVSYFAAFLTDYAKFPVVMSGAILTIVGIGDAITQPFSGVLVTKMNMKWGKYRSWYLVGPPIVALFFILGYTKLGSDMTAAVVIVATYVLCRFTFNCIWSAHLALIPYITKDPAERSFLSASRGIYQTVGTFIFSAISLTVMTVLVDHFGQVTGVTITAAVFSLFMIAGYLVSYFATKGVEEPKLTDGEAKEKTGFMDFINSIIKNPPLLVLMIAEFLRNISNFMFTIFIFYYWKYTTDSFLMYSAFMTGVNLVKLVGASATAYIAGKIGPKNAYLFGSIACGLFFILAWLNAGNIVLFTAFCMLAFFAVSLPVGVTSIMFTHTAMYSQWKTGKDNRAFVVGLIGFPVKIASFVKGTLMAIGLTAMGYVADGAVTPAVVSGIYKEVALMPGIWSLLSGIVVVFYALNNKMVKQMTEQMGE